jgi:hypothetical protein
MVANRQNHEQNRILINQSIFILPYSNIYKQDRIFKQTDTYYNEKAINLIIK